MILGIGFSDPFLVGVLALCLLLALIFVGVRVVFAAATVGLIGLVELCWAGAPPRASSAPSPIPNRRPMR